MTTIGLNYTQVSTSYVTSSVVTPTGSAAVNVSVMTTPLFLPNSCYVDATQVFPGVLAAAGFTILDTLGPLPCPASMAIMDHGATVSGSQLISVAIKRLRPRRLRPPSELSINHTDAGRGTGVTSAEPSGSKPAATPVEFARVPSPLVYQGLRGISGLLLKMYIPGV